MTFTESITTCLAKKYATFTGRASRSEFWWFMLFGIVIGLVLRFTFPIDDTLLTSDNVPMTNYIANVIVSLAFLLPNIGVMVRRLHDTGRSGWWWLLNFVPCVGLIVLIVFWCGESKEDNVYGPRPTK